MPRAARRYRPAVKRLPILPVSEQTGKDFAVVERGELAGRINFSECLFKQLGVRVSNAKSDD